MTTGLGNASCASSASSGDRTSDKEETILLEEAHLANSSALWVSELAQEPGFPVTIAFQLKMGYALRGEGV